VNLPKAVTIATRDAARGKPAARSGV